MFSKLTPLAETNIPSLLCENAAGRLLHSDSRQIKQGDIFIACPGEYADGRSYIPTAVANGAAFVFWDDDGKFAWNPEWKVPNQGIKDLKHRAGMLAAQVYGNVSDDLKVWGVTGTNGKTSITQWLAQAADLLGEKTAIIGTVGNGFWGALEETTHTPPPSMSKPCSTVSVNKARQPPRWKSPATALTNRASTACRSAAQSSPTSPETTSTITARWKPMVPSSRACFTGTA